MMKRYLLAAFLAWCAPFAFGQSVDVQTGEHDTFTRAVVTLPDGADWSLGRRQSGYRLQLSSPVTFDLSGFYELIPRDRIADVENGTTRGDLDLTVTCDCHAVAFEYANRFVVIDVKDGPALPSSPYERPIDQADALTMDVGGFGTGPLPLFFSGTAQSDRNTDVDDADTAAIDPDPAPEPAPPTPAAPMGPEFAQLVARELAEGLSYGVIVPDLQSDQSAPADPAPAVSTDLGAARWPGIVTSDTRIALAPEPVTQSGLSCLPDAFFDLPSWASDAPFHTQLVALEADLVAADGSFSSEATARLARFYLHFGFGAEARAALALDGSQTLERQYLLHLSYLLDGQKAPPTFASGQASCDGPVALWAVLSVGAGPFDAQANIAAISRSFVELPPHLQPRIAGPLADQLIRLGALDAALAVLEASGEEGAALAASQVNLASRVADGDPFGRAQEMFANGRPDPEAALLYLREGIAAGHAFTSQDFLRIEAVQFEFQDDPMASALWAAYGDALSSVGAFGRAADLLARPAIGIGPDQIAARKDQLFSQATEQLSDGAFLEFIWERDRAGLEETTLQAIEARLAALGFNAPATQGGPALENPAGALPADPELPDPQAGQSTNGPEPQNTLPPTTLPFEGVLSAQPAMPGSDQAFSDERALLETSAATRARLEQLLAE